MRHLLQHAGHLFLRCAFIFLRRVRNMTRYIRQLDTGDRNAPDAFKNLRLQAVAYDLAEHDATEPPTRRPSRRPKRRPTPRPTAVTVAALNVAVPHLRETPLPTAAPVAPPVDAIHGILLRLWDVEEVAGDVYRVPSAVRQVIYRHIQDFLNNG